MRCDQIASRETGSSAMRHRTMAVSSAAPASLVWQA
jgi:hypothetical protein